MIRISTNGIHLTAMACATGNDIEHVMLCDKAHAIFMHHIFNQVCHPTEPDIFNLDPIRMAQDASETLRYSGRDSRAHSFARNVDVAVVVPGIGDAAGNIIAEDWGRKSCSFIHLRAGPWGEQLLDDDETREAWHEWVPYERSHGVS